MNARRRGVSRPGAAILIFLFLCLVAGGLWYWSQVSRPSPRFALQRTGFAAIEGWKAADERAALAAFRRSCAVILGLPPAHAMSGAGYAGTAADWQPACLAAEAVPAEQNARLWFESSFVPFRAAADRTALFTGYYEPEIRASRTRHGPYAVPVYGRPADLVIANLGLFRSSLAGLTISGRVENDRLVPFPTRAKIDAKGLDAAVLVWANDPVAVFFLHIQGSGRALLDDGSTIRLAFAGQNGHAYTPIGRILIAKGDIDRADMSMQAIRSWLKSHPANARAIMESDQSYVFFRELPVGNPGLGGPGTEGVPLTPEASIAVDSGIHALGIPMFVATDSTAPGFARLCIAQDTGGAIRGGTRADIFWGFGAAAEDNAGRMKAGGALYVLLPKALAKRIGSRFELRS